MTATLTATATAPPQGDDALATARQMIADADLSADIDHLPGDDKIDAYIGGRYALLTLRFDGTAAVDDSEADTRGGVATFDNWTAAVDFAVALTHDPEQVYGA